MRTFTRSTAIAAALLALASCGGGGDDGGPPSVAPVATNTPPASASGSSDGFVAFLKTLVATTPDNTEPLDLSAFTAPVNDTGDPDPSI